MSLREERRPPRDDVEEVAPGVLRIQLPISMPGLGHVNCYAMEDKRGVALIDPGLPGPRTWRSLTKRLTSAGLSVDAVHTVVITHSHPDHFGQAAKLQRKVGAEIVTHESFRTFLDPQAEADEDDLVTVAAGQPTGELDPEAFSNERPASVGPVVGDGPFFKNTPWGGKPFQLPLGRRVAYWAMRRASGLLMTTPQPTRRVSEADVLSFGGREWVSVHTPGHTEDHLCLWDPADGVMISGDHVLPTITPHISGMGVTTDPLADFMHSLERMETFDGVTSVLPAHGLEFTDLAGRAASIKTHHHERLETLREAGDVVGNGTVNDYMRQLFQSRSWGSMAESETYAHLEHLRLTGDATVSSDGMELRYRVE